MRRKPAARGERRVMSEGGSGRCEARRTARGAKRAGTSGERGAVRRKRAARRTGTPCGGRARRAGRGLRPLLHTIDEVVADLKPKVAEMD